MYGGGLGSVGMVVGVAKGGLLLIMSRLAMYDGAVDDLGRLVS